MAEAGNPSGGGVQSTVEPASGAKKLRDRLLEDFGQGMGYKEASAKENCSWQYAYTVYRRFKSQSANEKEPSSPESAPATTKEEVPKEEAPEVQVEERPAEAKPERPKGLSEKALAKRQEILKDMILSTNVLWRHVDADELSEGEAESVAAVWAPFVDPRQLGMAWAAGYTALVFSPRLVQTGAFMVSKLRKKPKEEAKGEEAKEIKAEAPKNQEVTAKNENAQ